MKILAIETSCDETAIAILECTGSDDEANFNILGNALLSQIEIHKEYGGVFPNLAKREHAKNLISILESALEEAGFPEIDAIAVTAGPGLEPALWVGINFAKILAFIWNKPLVPVNHMEGHILAALAQERQDDSSRRRGVSLSIGGITLPLLALLISGGHTQLVLMREWLKYELIGETRDDAVGEAFDKVARMLELPYPGGPEISKLAEELRTSEHPAQDKTTHDQTAVFGSGNASSGLRLPRPMINSGTCDFSFAGLKTAVLYLLKDIKADTGMIYHTTDAKLDDQIKKAIAHEFENAVADVLWKKTADAIEKTGAKTLVIGGGVSANKHIQRIFKDSVDTKFPQVELRIPTPALSTDNAIMIALAGYYRTLRKEFPNDIKANGNLSLI